MRVSAVAARELLGLRSEVLGWPRSFVPGDEAEDALHVAVRDEQGQADGVTPAKCSPPDILHLVRNNVVSTQAGQLQTVEVGGCGGGYAVEVVIRSANTTMLSR